MGNRLHEIASAARREFAAQLKQEKECSFAAGFREGYARKGYEVKIFNELKKELPQRIAHAEKRTHESQRAPGDAANMRRANKLRNKLVRLRMGLEEVQI